MIEDVRDAVTGDGADATPPAGDNSTNLPVEDAATPEGADSAESASAAPVFGGAVSTEGVDYKDRWLRAEADLQTFRRRAVRDREEAVVRAEESLLLEVIGALDDLERALAAMSAQQAEDPWTQGVVLTAQRMRDMLGRYGVTAIPSVGEPFDPNVHEALVEIPAPAGIAPGSVAQEVQKGYRRGDRALRAARVVVARAGEEG